MFAFLAESSKNQWNFLKDERDKGIFWYVIEVTLGKPLGDLRMKMADLQRREKGWRLSSATKGQ